MVILSRGIYSFVQHDKINIIGFLGHYEASEIMKTMIRSVPNAYLGQVPIDKNTNIKLCTKLREAKNTKKRYSNVYVDRELTIP